MRSTRPPSAFDRARWPAIATRAATAATVQHRQHQARAQLLLAKFSEANNQLAFENDKLRTGRQALAQDHDQVLREIEYLRARLAVLEPLTGTAARTSPPRRQGSGASELGSPLAPGARRHSASVTLHGPGSGSHEIACAPAAHSSCADAPGNCESDR